MSFFPRVPNQKTAFGELLVANLYPQIQQNFAYTVDNTQLNTNTVTGTGVVSQADAMAVLATSTTTGSSASLHSHQHAKYRAGLGGLFRFTALFTSGASGTEQYVAIADEVGSSGTFMNGYGVGFEGETFGVHRWQNDVKFSIALEDCDDPLDGTGASGMTFDATKLNVFQIRYQYLGGGEIEFGIEDDSTGKFVPFHMILYSNLNTTPSVYMPNFRATYWVDNKATSANVVLKSSSYAYFIEGKTSLVDLQQPIFATGKQEKTSVTSEVAIVTIRNKSTYASKPNNLDILMLNTFGSSEANTANNLASTRLVKNATLGGTPSYSDINTTDSIVEYDIAGTTVTGGIELETNPLAGKNDSYSKDLIDFKIILDPGETLTIAGSSANNATIDAGFSWRELF